MLPKFVEQKLLLIDVKNELPAEAKFEDIIKSASSDFDEKALDGLMESAGVDSPTMFDAHLRAQGSSLRKLRETWTVSQVVRYFLSQKIKTDAEVSHKELLDYYREHEADYAKKAKARWEQVMVRHSKFSSTSDAMSAIVEMGNKIVLRSFIGRRRQEKFSRVSCVSRWSTGLGQQGKSGRQRTGQSDIFIASWAIERHHQNQARVSHHSGAGARRRHQG